MADEALHTVELVDNFYRDSFGKVIFVISGFILELFIIIAFLLYFYLSEPPPIVFPVENEWRVQANVPLDQPYRTIPDMLQWVSDVLQKIFFFDFINYNTQLKSRQGYFTDDGWKVYLNQLNNYASANNVQTNKQFINSNANGAPFIVNKGVLTGTGRYAWWVQMPITINYYSGYNRFYSQSLTLQVLVVRVPTLNNLDGIGIDNIIVAKTSSENLLGQ